METLPRLETWRYNEPREALGVRRVPLKIEREKTMGGRGSSGGSGGGGGGGAIGKANPIELVNERSRSSGNQWKNTILSASADSQGNLTFEYATPDSYENPNRNTTRGRYSLDAGVYNQPGDRKFRSHNINWANVRSASGSTYDIRAFLKSQGLTKWDSKNKRWVRG